MLYQQPDLAQVNVSHKQIMRAMEHDPEFFIQFYIGDEIDTPVPVFHVDEFLKMTAMDLPEGYHTVPPYACAIPRDHAKTTLAKLACIYLMIFSPWRFFIYLSNTASISYPAAVDITNLIQKPNSVAVFGQPEFETNQAGKGFYIFRWLGKRYILRALGAGQQVRGMNIDNQRPQVAVVDDLEDNDNIANDVLFTQLKEWFWGPFMKCLDKRSNKIIHIGNLLKHKQMLREHIENDYWIATRYGAIKKNGEPLWPDMFTLERLKADYFRYQSMGLGHIWMAEMMNMPSPAGSGLIGSNDIMLEPAPQPGDQQFACITIDPAFSAERWAHKCCIAVHAFVDGKWRSAEHHADKGMDPIDIFTKTIELATRWGAVVVGIESVQFQAALKPVFEYMAAQQNLNYLLFVNMKDSKRSKTPRLSAWAAMIRSGDYALNEGDFAVVDQLLAYNPQLKENDDDIIDAYSYIVEMTEEYNLEITQTFDVSAQERITRSVYDLERHQYARR